MEKFIFVKNYEFKLIFNAAKCVEYIMSDYCDDSILNFLNKNKPNNLKKNPEIEKYITDMIDEYNKNN